MSKALNTFESLKKAYETSTLSDNRFKAAVERVAWDETFYADGEHYFILGDLTFTAPSLDPFNMDWKPEAMFADGSFMAF